MPCSLAILVKGKGGGGAQVNIHRVVALLITIPTSQLTSLQRLSFLPLSLRDFAPSTEAESGVPFPRKCDIDGEKRARQPSTGSRLRRGR